MNSNAPARVSDVDGYTSPWLKPEDLKGKAIKLRIGKVTVEEVRNSDGAEMKIIVAFEKARKKWILNKTQANVLVAAFGDELAPWVGNEVVLSPMMANNGKLTIAVMVAPQEAGETNPFAA